VQTGLLSYVPRIWDNDPCGETAAAEILHPYGIAGLGGEVIEAAIGTAAHEAAIRAAYPERVNAAANEGFVYLCPIRTSVPNACMVGIARLRYRPHTTRTGAWVAELESSSPEIAPNLPKRSPSAVTHGSKCKSSFRSSLITAKRTIEP
jgi:hypothetical protein